MILVDTSVWVNHLRRGDSRLSELLKEGSVLVHPLVIEELACGNLSRADEILELLHALPRALEINHAEFLEFILRYHLQGKGLGAIDVHLLASSRLSGARLWTRDKKLHRIAEHLNLI